MSSKPFNVVRALSWLAVGMAALATVGGLAIIAMGNDVWAAFAFGMVTTSVNLGILLLAILPSGIAYLRNRQREDRANLLRASGSFVVMLIEALLLNCLLPMRGE